MTTIYLVSQTIIYCLLGIWCLWKPLSTSVSVGFLNMSQQGVAEFVAVYGGLEFGLGVFFGFCSFIPALRNTGILFACCLYGGLVAFRSAALIFYGSEIGSGWNFYYFEILMLVAAMFLFWKNEFAL